jgi:Mn2+/Fe2+ NRAMP family transporter
MQQEGADMTLASFAAPLLQRPVINREDALRALDRSKVLKARLGRHSLRLMWLLVGPGVLVMLGENDGPSMVSYATTGASYGVGFFAPFILVTFLMAYVVQEMTVRVGIATHRGHAELIFERFGKFWGYFALGDLVFGNLLTLVTEFIAIQAGGLYFSIAPWISVGIGAAVVFSTFALRRYATWERSAMGLAVFNLLFIPAALCAHPDSAKLATAIASWRPLPETMGVAFVTLILSNVGATVTPWMIFFQQSAVVDKGLTRADLQQSRFDTVAGAVLAAIAAIATLVAAAPLFDAHVDVSQFSSGADFASSLKPLIGGFGSSLFALGIIEAGLLAAMTISTSSSYAFAEVAHKGHSLNLNFSDGKVFFGVAVVSTLIAAAVPLIPGAPLVALTLTVNVIATLLMAPALLLLLLLANDREIMGQLVNGWRANLAGGLCVAAISLIGAAYGVITVFPDILPK